mgnify:CR=1 FL=1
MVMKDILSVFRDRNFYVSIIFASAGAYLLEESLLRSIKGVASFSGLLGRISHDLMIGAGTVFIVAAVLFMIDMFR